VWSTHHEGAEIIRTPCGKRHAQIEEAGKRRGDRAARAVLLRLAQQKMSPHGRVVVVVVVGRGRVVVVVAGGGA
jgi:hypothetical protein